VGLVRELPPQRGGGRPPALLCGGGGPCRGHTAVPVALRRRCARRRAAWHACRTIDKAGAELGLMLGAFRRHPRPALLIVRMFHDIAWCAVSRRFSRPRPKIPARASRRLFHDDRLGRMYTVRAPSCVLHANAGPTPHTQFCDARHGVHRQLSDHIFSCCAWNQPHADGFVLTGAPKILRLCGRNTG